MLNIWLIQNNPLSLYHKTKKKNNMDKLVKYIEQRSQKYGYIKGEQCISSNYYTFGDSIVRISDHIKYGAESVKKIACSFIIQPNDTYIFVPTPKMDSRMGNKMYLKVVTLKEAKMYIRKLHEFTIINSDMNEMFSPDGWNRGNMSYNKPTWSEFMDKYMSELNDQKKVSILDIIETIHTGKNSKGGLVDKLERIPEMYEKLSLTQYDTLISKIENKI